MAADPGAQGACAAQPAVDWQRFTDHGPYAVSYRDFQFVDRTRPTPKNGTYAGAQTRTLATRVFYPTAGSADAPVVAGSPPLDAAQGPLPLLAYAHGFMSNKEDAHWFAEHLASHGYIVAAPTFPLSNRDAPGGPTVTDLASQPGDLAFVLSSVRGLTGADAGLAALVDARRQGIVGLSLGGGTVLLAAYHPRLRLPDVQAAVAHAPVSCLFGPALYARALPTLIISGDADQLVPFQSGPQRALDAAPPPVALLGLRGGTHVGFIGLDLGHGNSDDLGCQILQSGNPAQGLTELYQKLDEGLMQSVVTPDACEPFCSKKFTQTMSAQRQLDLARAATLLHFEATLRGRAEAACALTPAAWAAVTDAELRAKR